MNTTKIGKETTPLLELKNVTKVFGHTVALNEMNFTVCPGEIVGLIGSNGAGKSTLMKVITGVYSPTSGSITNEAKEVNAKQYNATEAKKRGIACAYQELSLCTNLNTYENFAISHMDHSPVGSRGWRKHALSFAQEKIDEIFPDSGIDLKMPVSSLKLAQRQMVEISKAASADGLKLLILDEPTSSLTSDRIEQLHASMRSLCKQGVAIIYISHKLDEIDRICDRITVMKAGANILSADMDEITPQQLIEIMGGKAAGQKAKAQERPDTPVVLQISHLETTALHDINLDVRQGEIVGISGLAGSGQKELLLAIFEAQRKKFQKTVTMSTRASFVSGDRNTEGVFPFWNIADNTLVSSYEQVSKRGVLLKQKMRTLAQFWYDKLKFRAAGIDDDITSLSGGNQQKALIARGICADAGIIILNDSTCGVDLETKQEIYHLLDEARSQGKTVIWHSTEDLEMEQCDRVVVMGGGSIIGVRVQLKQPIRAQLKSPN
ncbi:sugar ABC transporter ATP-binding protein [Oscillibacter sp.]|uniref:sugar ABC transporter ATP-binding protein n=1 Tax=Oscillibacter sp. TaxID=1945593 RepID=UPI0026102FC6|nr:sugar ABC transporter ATP-binding protein [Oscillibacter sp.]MDD3346753.1 sugar ABC transporter ATP-binding protein [Oscillibacter sp.]